jgi:hypothetical protein
MNLDKFEELINSDNNHYDGLHVIKLLEQIY